MRQTKQSMLSDITKEISNCNIIGNNTLRINYKDGSEAIRLHNTDIITFKGNKIILNSGGWRTHTTKARINEYLPEGLNLFQQNNIWYISRDNNYNIKEAIVYYDNITFNKEGKLISKVKKDNTKKVNKLKRQITKFINLLDKDNIPIPNNGDCWYCLLKEVNTNKPLSDITKDNSHLRQHLKDGYLHGSLIVNSMLEAGYSQQQIGIHYHMKLVDSMKRSLRKYLYKRLLQEA